jgi:hypothetical protein
VDFNNAVVVASYSDHATAEAAVSLLKSEGIEAAVSADDVGGEMPNLDLASGARVIVEEKDAELARGLLNANEASS